MIFSEYLPYLFALRSLEGKVRVGGPLSSFRNIHHCNIIYGSWSFQISMKSTIWTLQIFHRNGPHSVILTLSEDQLRRVFDDN